LYNLATRCGGASPVNSEPGQLTAGKRIAVSGGGIGGTAFALALEHACKARGITPMPVITIFERDATPTEREKLGYSFSLMQDGETGPGGLQARLTAHIRGWNSDTQNWSDFGVCTPRLSSVASIGRKTSAKTQPLSPCPCIEMSHSLTSSHATALASQQWQEPAQHQI